MPYVIFVFSVWIIAIIGWIWNIAKIIESDLTPITTMLILRFIGIFIAPLGSVLGYF